MKNTYITRVLVCRPSYYQVNYSINPWMVPGSVDVKRAMDQWETLVDVYQRLGVDVEIIDQRSHLPDMVFTADQGIVKGNMVLLSNFRYPERQGERDLYGKWFRDHNLITLSIPDDCCVEGHGEAIFWRDKLLLGIGFRANKEAASAICEELEVEVVPLQLVDPKFYHLDTCFFALNSETAFFYPHAFSESSQKMLRKIVPRLLALTNHEANSFCANSVVTDHQVLINAGCPSFARKIRQLGYQAHEVEMSEFIKSGGGIHCLTQVLLQTIC